MQNPFDANYGRADYGQIAPYRDSPEDDEQARQNVNAAMAPQQPQQQVKPGGLQMPADPQAQQSRAMLQGGMAAIGGGAPGARNAPQSGSLAAMGGAMGGLMPGGQGPRNGGVARNPGTFSRGVVQAPDQSEIISGSMAALSQAIAPQGPAQTGKVQTGAPDMDIAGPVPPEVQAARDAERLNPTGPHYGDRLPDGGFVGHRPPSGPLEEVAAPQGPMTPGPNWNTDGYAAPAQIAQNFRQQAPAGWDQEKWNNGDHQTPKYVWGRITEDDNPNDIEQLLAAYPGAEFNGKDTVTGIPGLGPIDVYGGASQGLNKPQWFDKNAAAAEGGGGDPMMAALGASSPEEEQFAQSMGIDTSNPLWRQILEQIAGQGTPQAY